MEVIGGLSHSGSGAELEIMILMERVEEGV